MLLIQSRNDAVSFRRTVSAEETSFFSDSQNLERRKYNGVNMKVKI